MPLVVARPLLPAGLAAAAVEGRDSKGEDGRARTREVKMAAAFTRTRLDDDGYPVREPGSLEPRHPALSRGHSDRRFLPRSGAPP
jgi:hypothetical protein